MARRPYLRSGPAEISTAIGQGVSRVKGTRSGVATFSADLRGQGGVSAIAASISAIRAGSASLSGSAAVGGAGNVVIGGQTKAAAAAVAGSAVTTAAATVVPPDPGVPATFDDYVPSTAVVINGTPIPWTIYGETSVDATFADSNSGHGLQGAGALTPVASSGMTIATMFTWQTAQPVVGQTYTEIDFTGHRVQLPVYSGSGPRTTFVRCRFKQGMYGGNPLIFANNYHSGGSGINAARCDADFDNCEFVGDNDDQDISYFVHGINSIHHFYACSQYGSTADLCRVGGFTAQWCWYANNIYHPDWHQDMFESPNNVSKCQVVRCTIDLHGQVTYNALAGPNSFWKDRLDGVTGATVNFDRLAEECVIKTVNNGTGGHYIIRNCNGSGASATGKQRRVRIYGYGYRSGFIHAGEVGALATVQDCRDLTSGQLREVNVVTAPDGAPVLTVSSAASGEITLAFPSSISNATHYEAHYRIRGERRWRLVDHQIIFDVTSPFTITGLDATKYYEAEVRAVNGSGFAGTVGPWSNRAYAKANGGEQGGQTVGLVSDLINTAATSDTLTFTFTAAPNATSHERQYSSNGGVTWTASQSITSPFSLAGFLSPSTTYSVRVRGVSATLGNGEWVTTQASTTSGAGIAVQTIGAAASFLGNGGNDAQTMTVDVPAVNTGDLMLLLVGCRQSTAVTPPVDWISEGLANIFANIDSVQVYSKVAAGNAAATTMSVGFVDARNNSTTTMRVVTFRGGTGDVEAFAENGKIVAAGQSTCAGSSITTLGTDRIVCSVWRTSNSATGSIANSAGPPTGWTEQFEDAAASGYCDMFILDTIAAPTAGAVSAPTLSPTNPVSNYVVATFAVF